MKKRRYVVRVVQTQSPDGVLINEGGIIDDSFIESLRYAGVIDIHRGHPDSPRHNLTARCFDILCPSDIDSMAWAEANAERMRSFGYNAVSAPSTR